MCRYFSNEVSLNDKKVKGVRLGLYATAIQGWYVPTMLDIRKLPINEDLVAPTEKEEEIQSTLEDVLNEFLSNNGDEEE